MTTASPNGAAVFLCPRRLWCCPPYAEHNGATMHGQRRRAKPPKGNRPTLLERGRSISHISAGLGRCSILTRIKA